MQNARLKHLKIYFNSKLVRTVHHGREQGDRGNSQLFFVKPSSPVTVNAGVQAAFSFLSRPGPNSINGTAMFRLGLYISASSR